MKDAKAIIIYSMTRIGVHFALVVGAIMLLAFVTIVAYSLSGACVCCPGLVIYCRRFGLINPTLFRPARLR